MGALRLIMGDQLSERVSSLEGLDQSGDVVLMCELRTEATYVPHHPKKIAFLFAAMRHFAESLRERGVDVRYIAYDNPENTGSFTGELERAIAATHPDRIISTFPGEYRVLREIEAWQQEFGLPVEIRPDTRFLSAVEDFDSWAEGRKELRMEFFYRTLRTRYGVLMEGGAPAGGKWNYDSENRKPPNRDMPMPEPSRFVPDEITRDVLNLVGREFSGHFGLVEPFHYAVTRAQALVVLDAFVHERLPSFGDYQDAMLTGEPWMYHAHIGLYLNAGLLEPMECIRAAERAYYSGDAPLNAVEGFIRQILGWREYVRGIYWLRMPEFAQENVLKATRALPAIYWGAPTRMNCLHQCVQDTRENAYAHHIQRLMVLGNFALLAGLAPQEVQEWYLAVYADAFEWVELPNVSGMVLYADGGVLASKPYAAGGNYISKMSDYCDGCSYDVRKKNGPKACPFNYLYWDFLARNRDVLGANARLRMAYTTYDRMAEDKRTAIAADATRFLSRLDETGSDL